MKLLSRKQLLTKTQEVNIAEAKKGSEIVKKVNEMLARLNELKTEYEIQKQINNESHTKFIESKRQEVAELNNQVVALKAHREQLLEPLDEIKKGLENKEYKLLQLERDLAKQTNNLGKLEDKLGKKAGHIKLQEEAIKMKIADLDDRENYCVKQEKYISKLEKDLFKKQDTWYQFKESKEKEIEQTQAEIFVNDFKLKGERIILKQKEKDLNKRAKWINNKEARIKKQLEKYGS
jgi:hypothetical protein